ncbi:carbon storage regulator, partial [Clostridiaceae bacterium HSG29]|nr:carbon storage regulator [Clostridiaceae bacterium HSG29]
IIGKDIEIKIIKAENGKVKIGIEAPKDVEINRKEIFEEIQNQNKEAINKQVDIKKIKEIYMKKDN